MGKSNADRKEAWIEQLGLENLQPLMANHEPFFTLNFACSTVPSALSYCIYTQY